MIATRFACLLPLACFAALCQTPAALTVQGLDNSRATFSLADLAKLPRQTVKATDHGAAVTYEGVQLAHVLAKVALPLGEKFHSTGASYYLVVEAADGYRAVFAWAEIDPGFMDKPIYVVTARDGKPLPEKAGPLQLYVPGEKRGGRSVRQVTAIRLARAN
jgi:DMSO/TMAO reductase YedYZ molybdopterin-dependent catalytic subunit